MATAHKKIIKKNKGSHKTTVKTLMGRKKKIRFQKKKRTKKPKAHIIKYSGNPIISPKPENVWEAWQTFNPGVILLENKIHFIYRAIGGDGISRFGYAVSENGFQIDERLQYPIYEHRLTHQSFGLSSFPSGGSWGGCEDPRIVRVKDEDTLFMTYTACDEGLRVALTSIRVEDFLYRRWKWKSSKLISPPGEVHKNWVIFPDKINGKYAILHSISPEISITYLDNLNFDNATYIRSNYNSDARRKNCWDNWIRGAGAPPVKTPKGWLLFYHAMDEHDPGRYKVGAMLLDLNDPTKVLHRSSEPILEPDEWYENNGFKSGVVYVLGAVVKDGELLVYYGGADNYTCVASANLDKFLKALTRKAKPKLIYKIVKKK